MAKNEVVDVDLDALLAQREEARANGSVTVHQFTFDGETVEKTEGDTFSFKVFGKTWVCRDPQYLTDDEKDQLSPLQFDSDVAAWYLGEEQYDQFTAAGGESWLFLRAFADYQKKVRDENQGKPYTAESLLASCPEAWEASLEAYYGYDVVRAYWRGEITLRKLRVYVENLPPSYSPFWVEDNKGNLHPWSWNEWLLWRLLWLVEWAAVRVARSLGDKSAKLKRDKPLQYPWSTDRTVVKYGDRGDLTNEQAKAILDAL
ncbi:tail assembly chaperone [Gordonia phage Ghobes]|uniref:Tail assembly chaperone n=1 Tax=Gordonia phage Ghobes TaxID=1887647 RepID=A0A1B3B070_9CAUD|nr:tail assembly chaperone [Gordonia phage Ghobes]AOE44366.1 tail assembly chaperone [Gordonia phage Ghobes]